MDVSTELTDEGEPLGAEVLETRDAKPWLRELKRAETAFEKYEKECDRLSREIADLKELSSHRADRELQVLWANREVLRPTIYAREPVPVVTDRYKSGDPVKRKAAEILERALIADFEMDDIDGKMRLLRDDLIDWARGVPWIRVENDRQGRMRVVCDHVDRKDFRHGPTRKWSELPWGGRRHYLDRDQMRERFGETFSGDWTEINYDTTDLGAAEGDYESDKKCEVWEIWHKAQNVVVWITENVETVLDAQPPYLDLENFWPFPRPAYATLQPGTLIPIPDAMFYMDQVQEVNDLTSRIGSLMEGLDIVGFYPGGAADIGEAVETALEMINSGERRIKMVPIKSMAALQQSSGGKLVEYWPVDQVAGVLRELVEQRRQLIDDIYQITGLSDIMRGATEASETATAQSLKAQYGSIRVRSRQEEMVRLARDITRIKAEIMAEFFDGETLLEMSQVQDVPSVMAEAEARGAMLTPEQAQAASQAMLQQGVVTIEAVMMLLRQERTRPFMLEIETDSTIQPDEDAEKQRRTEFLQAVGGFAQQALPMVQAFPQSGKLVGAMLKFTADGFRAGRDLEQEIEAFTQGLEAVAQAAMQPQQQQPDPKTIEAEAKARDMQADRQMKAQGQQHDQQLAVAKLKGELALKEQEITANAVLAFNKMAAELGIKADAEAFKQQLAEMNALRSDTEG